MKGIVGTLIVTCILIGMSTVVVGQTIDELRKQKLKTAAEIKYTNQLLKETSKNKDLTINKLVLLNRQISLQSNLIEKINREIAYIQGEIETNSYVVESLAGDLVQIKETYAGMLRYARRNGNKNNQLLYLLSSEDFNQAYKRFIYLKQYANYRKKQVELINAVKRILDSKVVQLERQKNTKNELLRGKENESELLVQKKLDQNRYHAQLQKKQRELKKKLNKQRRVEEKLEREIERIIAEEARKAAELAAKNEMSVIRADTKLSADFAANKGKFPWPVAKGVITEKFGEHPHPVLKQVKVRNSGINITTGKNTKAQAIFSGEVSRVVAIPGGNMAVIVRHGGYLTVYSNLSKVFVTAGQKVQTKQAIGEIFTDATEGDKAILKFQLWHENKKENPEDWIVKK